jgi:hypothetical protein
MGSHFLPFTHVLRENWPAVTRKNAGIDLTDALALARLPISPAMIAAAEYSVCNLFALDLAIDRAASEAISKPFAVTAKTLDVTDKAFGHPQNLLE